MTAAALTAAQILAIPDDVPEKLFSKPEAIEHEYRALAMSWHPDRSTDHDCERVAAHINVLHDAARRKAKLGDWTVPGEIRLHSADGKSRTIRYKKKHAFELGEMAYSSSHVTFLLQNDYADLFHQGRMAIRNLRYSSYAMKAEMARFLPAPERHFESDDGRCVLMLKKTPDVYLLRDIVAAAGGRLDPKHVAWVLSATYNIACYLEHSRLTHNAISADTMFVSPEFHSGLLLGGWWYATDEGRHLNALPPFGHRLAPASMLKSKQASNSLDLALVRGMGRELLGDPTGMNLLGDGVPKPMATFLRQPTTLSARADYAAWHSVLEASFGARKFTKLELTEDQIFKD